MRCNPLSFLATRRHCVGIVGLHQLIVDRSGNGLSSKHETPSSHCSDLAGCGLGCPFSRLSWVRVEAEHQRSKRFNHRRRVRRIRAAASRRWATAPAPIAGPVQVRPAGRTKKSVVQARRLKDLRLSNAGRSGVTRPPAADSRQRILSINASSLPRRAEAPSVRRRSRPFVPLPAARTRPSLARAFRR